MNWRVTLGCLGAFVGFALFTAGFVLSVLSDVDRSTWAPFVFVGLPTFLFFDQLLMRRSLMRGEDKR